MSLGRRACGFRGSGGGLGGSVSLVKSNPIIMRTSLALEIGRNGLPATSIHRKIQRRILHFHHSITGHIGWVFN